MTIFSGLSLVAMTFGYHIVSGSAYAESCRRVPITDGLVDQDMEMGEFEGAWT
jgi:hypothetical protein